MVVVGFSQDDLGGTVNGVDFLFLDGLDSLDSKEGVKMWSVTYSLSDSDIS